VSSAYRPVHAFGVDCRDVDDWARWVTELEDHPLDVFEFEEALASRDRAVVALEILGPDADWAALDAIDARFQAVTVVDERTPFAKVAGSGWWRSRLPTAANHLAYLGIGDTTT